MNPDKFTGDDEEAIAFLRANDPSVTDADDVGEEVTYGTATGEDFVLDES